MIGTQDAIVRPSVVDQHQAGITHAQVLMKGRRAHAVP
jgi:hypothetical protein